MLKYTLISGGKQLIEQAYDSITLTPFGGLYLFIKSCKRAVHLRKPIVEGRAEVTISKDDQLLYTVKIHSE